MFTRMLEAVKSDVIKTLYNIQIRTKQEVEEAEEERRKALQKEQDRMRFIHASTPSLPEDGASEKGNDDPGSSNSPYVRGAPRVGRNDVCPCGSGKKFKHCHGKLS
jgi:preprotein translocase subunit SecA